MNKQLTKKTIGIAASAALMASVAFSGSALAAPGGEKGAPPPKDIACNLDNYDHACVETLKGVNAAILGADSVSPRDESTLRNKVCEANFKFIAEKLHDAAQKLTDISMTIESKRKVSDADKESISTTADDAAQAVLVSCQ